jgi:hypothetical protein
MIPPEPPNHAFPQLAQLKNRMLADEDLTEVGRRLWRIMFEHGSELPDDVGMTDR